MKKLFLIAIVAAGFLVAAAPNSEARVFFNIGIGLPPFGYYPYYSAYCPYPAYYGYGYYPYRYYGGVYYSNYRPYYWYHGRRIYYRHYR